jgi:hypothetical protein
MLSRGCRERVSEEGKKEALQDLHAQGKKRNWLIACALIRRFARLGNRDDVCSTPNYWYVRLGYREVEQLCQVRESSSAKTLQVPSVPTAWRET